MQNRRPEQWSAGVLPGRESQLCPIRQFQAEPRGLGLAGKPGLHNLLVRPACRAEGGQVLNGSSRTPGHEADCDIEPQRRDGPPTIEEPLSLEQGWNLSTRTCLPRILQELPGENRATSNGRSRLSRPVAEFADFSADVARATGLVPAFLEGIRENVTFRGAPISAAWALSKHRKQGRQR
jgi:hypothetical protein